MAAYRPSVTARLEAGGYPTPEDAITEGEAWLAVSLEELLGRPFAAQSRSPLEVFQEAMRFPTAALFAAGAHPVARDEVTAVALPGDLYDLAPASSQELGETAWHAHLAWGAAKAAAVRPVAVLVSRNLLDVSRLEQAVATAGYRLEVASGLPGATGGCAIGIVDLEHPQADAAVGILTRRCGRVVAYGPHVDDFAMTRARSLGAADAVPRSRFFTDPAEWLRPLA